MTSPSPKHGTCSGLQIEAADFVHEGDRPREVLSLPLSQVLSSSRGSHALFQCPHTMPVIYRVLNPLKTKWLYHTKLAVWFAIDLSLAVSVLPASQHGVSDPTTGTQVPNTTHSSTLPRASLPPAGTLNSAQPRRPPVPVHYLGG